MAYGSGLGAAVGGAGTFQSYQGTPVEEYLRAMFAAQQQGQPAPVANSAQAPASTPPPWNATWATNDNAIGASLGNNLASIDAQAPAIRASFGYLSSGDLDPSNPFGQAQLLKRNYEQSKSGNTNRYAARGQLYSGALQNAQNEAQFNYQANDANLRNQYQQQLAQLAVQRAQATDAANQQRVQNNWNLTNSASQPGNYGAAPPTGAVDYGTPNNGVSDIPGVTDAQYQQAYGAGSNWQNAFMEAFKASHGGLTPDEFSYLQALQRQAQGG